MLHGIAKNILTMLDKFHPHNFTTTQCKNVCSCEAATVALILRIQCEKSEDLS